MEPGRCGPLASAEDGRSPISNSGAVGRFAWRVGLAVLGAVVVNPPALGVKFDIPRPDGTTMFVTEAPMLIRAMVSSAGRS